MRTSASEMTMQGCALSGFSFVRIPLNLSRTMNQSPCSGVSVAMLWFHSDAGGGGTRDEDSQVKRLIGKRIVECARAFMEIGWTAA